MSFQSRRLDTNPKGATGPVTDAGKAVSSQTARKHGLNAPPDVALVSQWFNVILNNSGDDQEEPSATDPRREAALRLAIAEARYHRALTKLHARVRAGFRAAACMVARNLGCSSEGPKIADGRPDHRNFYANFAINQLEELFTQIGHERRLYKRYLGEARAQRAKALRAWCAFNRDEKLNSRNELKLQSIGE